MEEHVQDAAPHQHHNDVRVDIGQRDLGVVQELLENERKRKTKSRVKLLLAKKNGVVPSLFCGHWVLLH